MKISILSIIIVLLIFSNILCGVLSQHVNENEHSPIRTSDSHITIHSPFSSIIRNKFLNAIGFGSKSDALMRSQHRVRTFSDFLQRLSDIGNRYNVPSNHPPDVEVRIQQFPLKVHNNEHHRDENEKRIVMQHFSSSYNHDNFPSVFRIRSVEGIQYFTGARHRILGMTLDSHPLSEIQRHAEEFGNLLQQSRKEMSLYKEKLMENPNLAYVYNSFRNSTLFNELNRFSMHDYVLKNKVLGLWVLCDCERDNQIPIEVHDLEDEIKSLSTPLLNINPSAPNAVQSILKKKDVDDHEKNNHSNDSQDDEKEYEGISKHEFNPDDPPFGIQWLYIHKSEAEFLQIPKKYKLTSLPTFILDNVPESGIGNEKYVFHHEDEQGFSVSTTIDDLLKFVEDFKRGKLEMVVNSEKPHSIPKDGNVWEVVGKNFKQIVLNQEKDVLLLLYSPFNMLCSSIRQMFDLLAKAFEKENIIIAAMDHVKNDIPVRGIPVRIVPTILYFPEGDRNRIVNFKEFLDSNSDVYLDIDGILAFIREYATFEVPPEITMPDM